MAIRKPKKQMVIKGEDVTKHTHEQCSNVCTGQCKEEEVGGGPHGDVPEDDDADHGVAQRARDAHQHVDTRQRVQHRSIQSDV